MRHELIATCQAGGGRGGAPQAAAVLGADKDVVAAGVHMHGGDDAAAGEQRLGERLLHKVVDADIRLAGDEQQRLARVELAAGDLALALAERALAGALAQLVHDDALRRAAGARRHEVVPPAHAATPRWRVGGRNVCSTRSWTLQHTSQTHRLQVSRRCLWLLYGYVHHGDLSARRP